MLSKTIAAVPAIPVLFLLSAAPARADCASDLKSLEAMRANAVFGNPRQMQAVDVLIQQARQSQKEGKTIACVNQVKRAREILGQ
jgi:hypothetical protein